VDLYALVHFAEHWPMFATQCPAHPRPVLIGYDDITAVRRDRAGYTVTFRCTCGRLRHHHVRTRATLAER
jgi:hypothetical protein